MENRENMRQLGDLLENPVLGLHYVLLRLASPNAVKISLSDGTEVWYLSEQRAAFVFKGGWVYDYISQRKLTLRQLYVSILSPDGNEREAEDRACLISGLLSQDGKVTPPMKTQPLDDKELRRLRTDWQLGSVSAIKGWTKLDPPKILEGEVEINSITIPDWIVRKDPNVDDLLSDIPENWPPLHVVPGGKERFNLVCGLRRYTAARRLDRKTIRVRIRFLEGFPK